ncbi:MAG: nucleotidyltransferase domain-containing protein [Euryarchaeota archaeon]|nr:nucleotidyltransferase domain-containing protein [Euryarchaeota archaeon]
MSRLLAALKVKYAITKAIVFGSRARGDHHRHSDLDIVLVSPDFGALPFIDRPAEILRYWEGDWDLEPLCYTPEEYERLRGMMGILTVAEREGEVLAV